MRHANLFSAEVAHDADDPAGFEAGYVRLGPLIGATAMGATVYELGPGNFMIFHFHHGSEELLVVLRGRPTLRTLAGTEELDEGDAVHFPTGPDGAHEIRNDTAEPVRYVVAGTRVSPEVVEYPDLKQLTAQSRHDSMTGAQLFVIHDVKEEA